MFTYRADQGLGNHDITLDKDFYARHGASFHNKNPQSPDSCISLLKSSPSITYLDHSSATIRLSSSSSGPQTQFTVFGSPYSPEYGNWAFYYPPASSEDAQPKPRIWDDIPLNTDIVVTHTPPHGHCDYVAPGEKRPDGCEALRRALWRVRPRLAVCGHIHDGRGAETIRWNLDSSDTVFAESGTISWEDPGAGEGNKKTSLVDLTSRKGGCHLDNDGSKILGLSDADIDSLAGRLDRRETCVVNAAIMKSKYPHVGGKKYNKPIVVDLELPVLEPGE